MNNPEENDLYGFIITKEEYFIFFVSLCQVFKETSAAVVANVAKMIILDVTVELASCFANLLPHFYVNMYIST